jgi:transposase-like protein
MLTKVTDEVALNAELNEHLGYVRHEQSNHNNSCNGYPSKAIETEDREIDLDTQNNQPNPAQLNNFYLSRSH